MLRGIDRAAFGVSFAQRLRVSGVPVGLTSVESFVRALRVSHPASRGELYWTARVCLVRRHGDLPRFDAVFAAVFDDAVLELDPTARRLPLGTPAGDDDAHASLPESSAPNAAGAGLPWVTLPPVVGDSEDSESPVWIPERLPSELQGLTDVAFEQLTAEQLRLLGGWIETAVRTWPMRRSRRMAVDGAGHRIALRATVARSRRTGWEAVDLVHERAVQRPRRVVMLCDVSQSMQAQATAYLHLMRALTLGAHAEVFAFATTLTRLTATLAHRSAEIAIGQATAKVVDRFGGTRIAGNLQALLASHHGAAVRGAIVVIGSDGWDSEPPQALAAAMSRLHRRAHRVIWMNPRASVPGFQPRVATMAAALPFCDRFLPAGTFRSLGDVVAELAVSSRASRGSRGGTARR